MDLEANMKWFIDNSFKSSNLSEIAELKNLLKMKIKDFIDGMHKSLFEQEHCETILKELLLNSHKLSISQVSDLCDLYL